MWLNELRIAGKKVRVIRDAVPENDLYGIVIAWDATHVLLRKQNRKVVKVSKQYEIQPVES
jgi:hypothetical protein